MSEPWGSAGTTINRREQDHERVLYADPQFASQLRWLGEATVPKPHSGPWVLHNSPYAAARAVYATDDREAFDDEVVVVFPVEVAAGWGEIEIPVRADNARAEALKMMRAHGRNWPFTPLMVDLLLTLGGSIVAISVPVGDGRLIWVPMLTLLEGMVTVGSPQFVRMQRDREPGTALAGGEEIGGLQLDQDPDP